VAKQTTKTTNASGVTSGKLVLIGVLAVVLLGVLYLQYGEMIFKPAKKPQATVASAKPRSNGRKPNTAKKPVAKETAVTPVLKSTGSHLTWQSPELASVVSYDPFALPAAFPHPQQIEAASAVAQSDAAKAQDASVQRAALEAERTQLESALATLKQQGVQAVITKGNQSVVIVGGQEVRVGDEFQGFTVVGIDPDAIEPEGILQLSKDLTP
jgi:hypothetical protein